MHLHPLFVHYMPGMPAAYASSNTPGLFSLRAFASSMWNILPRPSACLPPPSGPLSKYLLPREVFPHTCFIFYLGSPFAYLVTLRICILCIAYCIFSLFKDDHLPPHWCENYTWAGVFSLVLSYSFKDQHST